MQGKQPGLFTPRDFSCVIKLFSTNRQLLGLLLRLHAYGISISSHGLPIGGKVEGAKVGQAYLFGWRQGGWRGRRDYTRKDWLDFQHLAFIWATIPFDQLI